MLNNTISRNVVSGSGGGICCFGSSPIIKNTVFWQNHANYGDEIDDDIGWPIVTYCDIGGGYEGQGNIDADPHFRNPENGDFHLMSVACGDPFDSPCIDAGDPSIFDFLLDCDWGLGSERSDMGAYGGQAIPTDIREREREIELPARLCLSQNYPNPFNSSTIINYSLPYPSYVTVSIYNLLGQLETTIFEGIQQAGRQTITWNADDYPSGIYFARVEADERIGNIRMVMIK